MAQAPSSVFSVALLAEFVRLGVHDVVVSPGSRSQALALAAADLEVAGHIRLHVRIDERSAGFLALGLSVESNLPVIVMCTSGTAVANLHPAVLEAYHSGVQLIVITADRPSELRGIGSNQTTLQPGIFGPLITSLDIDAPTETDDPGLALSVAWRALGSAAPVHLNLQFREPLSSATSPLAGPVEAPTPDWAIDLASSEGTPVPPDLTLHPAPGTVVVAGHAAGEIAESTARALGAPLLAEVSSGAHFGPNLVVDYRTLLNAANFGDRIERVIVFGHPTLSREIPALIQRPGVESIVMRARGPEQYNPGHAVTRFADTLAVSGVDESPAARSWLGRWVTTSRNALEQHEGPDIEIALSNEPRDQAQFNRQVIAGLRAPVTRRALVEAVWRMSWPHDRLVLGASRLIREADKIVPGKKIRVHANRGLAGIDGTIATAIGVAIASQGLDDRSSNGLTRVLLGDLALLHDAGSLALGRGEQRPRVQVIVGNDGGGTIFDSLEVAASASPTSFDRVQYTPQDFSIEHLAAAYGWEYRHVANRGELDAALTPGPGPTLIEVPLAR